MNIFSQLSGLSIFLLIVTIIVAFLIYHEKRTNSILSKWAAENGLQIVKRTSGLFRRCPFFFTLGHQDVFYLLVRDRQGRERGCWVRLGDFLFGSLFTDLVEVKWEDKDSQVS